MTEKKHILIGCTGSVASIKVPDLIHELKKYDCEIKIVPTEKSLHFFNPDQVSVDNITIHSDDEEWKWQSIGDPVLHIELRRWADILVIAPLDANTLAKVAHGLCDNLLTCVVRAWDVQKPLLFAPAMNTYMWEHPITAQQVQMLKDFGYTEIPCVEKKLACGDTGFGAMAPVATIVQRITEALGIT